MIPSNAVNRCLYLVAWAMGSEWRNRSAATGVFASPKPVPAR